MAASSQLLEGVQRMKLHSRKCFSDFATSTLKVYGISAWLVDRSKDLDDAGLAMKAVNLLYGM